MEFPTYHVYVAIVAARDVAMLTLAIMIAVFFELVYFLARYRPAWARVAIWLFGVGGFYASLLALALFIRARA